MRNKKTKQSEVKEQEPQVKIITEKEALQQLGISSFRKMSREKVPQFCTVMPYMEPEVARAALDKFPHFVNLMTDVVTCYRDIVNRAIETEAENLAQFNESCKLILNSLGALLQQKRIKKKERKMIIDGMMAIAQKQRVEMQESREWKAEIVKVFAAVAGVVSAVAAMVLGVHFGRK